MLKLVTLGVVVGGFMLMGCAEPATAPDYSQVKVEQTQKITKKSPAAQRDSLHAVSADYEK